MGLFQRIADLFRVPEASDHHGTVHYYPSPWGTGLRQPLKLNNSGRTKKVKPGKHVNSKRRRRKAKKR
jgi:hypothetical protein